MKNENKLTILNLYQEDFLYRHTMYWNIFYKFMYAILGLLALPYITHVFFVKVPLLTIIFPVVAIFINVFSLIILGSETVRMSASKNRIEDFSKIHLNGIYKQINIEPLIKKKLYSKICAGRVVEKVKVLNIILLAASFLEIILIIVYKSFLV